MDILATLAHEHREIRALLRALANTEGQRACDSRARLFPRLRDLLLGHAAGEERAFYPVLRELVGSGIDEVALDHQAMERQLDRLAALSMAHDRWRDSLRLLADSFDAHVRFEESDLFERLRRALSDERRDELDERFRSARAR